MIKTNHEFEPGSFRDRNARVFYSNNTVFRALGKQALKEWEILSSTAFFPRFMEEEKIVHTERVDPKSNVGLNLSEKWAGLLKHQTIPFVSYPYEWSFEMLKDAALLQINLLLTALDENIILKDSSAFNFQWIGVNPVFIDISSFEKFIPGEPWIGYRQFCQMFLYPLFLQAYKNIPFQTWLRGNINGIEPEDCIRFMSLRDILRPGVFLHAYLHAKAQKKYGSTQQNVKEGLRSAGFNKDLIKANVKRIEKVVQGLTWAPFKSEWSDYESDNSYKDTDRNQKESFVRNVVKSRSWNLVWDIGCNTGNFSRIASENADYVVAMDADQLAIERLYRTLKSKGNKSILPLVINVANPSPSLGWRGIERRSLMDRGKPELILCLAIIHHVVISANIPLREFIEWLASLGASLVIEFVDREDSMVKTLLRNKKDNYEDYETRYFEQCLSEFFDITKREVLSSGTRILYYAQSVSK